MAEIADPRFEVSAALTKAAALRHEGSYDECLALLQEIRRKLESNGARNGFIFEELGECLASAGRSDEAAVYFGLAFAELSKDEKFAAAEGARLERLARLGDVGEG